MPNFNLGTQQGFLSATSANLSGASSLLTNLLGASQWDILEASYQATTSTVPVLFHVFKSNTNYNAAVDTIQDEISRRVPEYKFPYVDGQGTDDLGREASVYEFDAIIWGPNYYAQYINLLNELNKPVGGTLIHPILGGIPVKFKSGRVTYKSKERQAVTLHLTFVESNLTVSFTTSAISSNPLASLKSAMATAAGFISSVSTQLTNVQGYAAVTASALLGVNTLVTSFTASFSQFLIALNVSFNGGTSADIPALVPANGTVSQVAYPSATATTGIFAGQSPSQVQSMTTSTVTVAQAQVQLNALAVQAQTLLTAIESLNNGQGSLIYYTNTNMIRQAMLAAKAALLQALQTSNQLVSNYTVPYAMSIRMACFLNGLLPDDSQDVLSLNPSLLSVNLIPQGTVLQIPSS